MGFVFYDTETTGTETSFDQILQFAAIRTDPELNEIDRFEIRCRLLPHVVPAPGAMRVTGVSAAQLIDQSLPSHYAMVRTIRDKLLSWSPAVFVGYNSLDFDEHLLRQAFYKTLHPPYLTNTEGNSRSDVLRMVQAASLFAPAALTLPVGDGGRTIFKLDRVAPANGFNHEDAHDAMGDVKATIFMCRLLKEKAPDVWSAFMRFSQKAAVADYVSSEPIFCLTDFFFGKPYSWLVTAIGTNPENASEFYVYDLGIHPESLASLSEANLAARLARSPKPIRHLRSNASPMLMPAEDAPAIAASLSLGMDELESRAELLHSDDAFRTRLIAAFQSTKEAKEPSPHIEMQIYDGFFSQSDGLLMDAFHRAPWEQRLSIVNKLEDARLKVIGRQLVHVERPNLLHDAERLEHDRAHARRVLGTDGDVPWLTLSKALEQVDDMLAACEQAEMKLLREHRRHLVNCLERATALLN
jgi:exodeoxyribonuclease-1